ncbi:MAG: T9SS type A sorting domain-containing protein [Ignavibacteria bacterium]
MKNLKTISIKSLIILLFLLIQNNKVSAQEIKWLRIGELQAPINEIGAEYEGEIPSGSTINNFFSWPVQYGIDQTTTRMKALWIGCKNFDDPVEKKLKSVKVIGSGPRDFADRPNQIFPVEIKLIGKTPRSMVSVDDFLDDDVFDVLDSIDANLPCDRMVLVRFNTSIGITVTKKVMAFATSEHGNYFINDYVFKNTGIYNLQGDAQQQTMQDVWFYFFYRYAFAGVTSLSFGSTWGHFFTTWGPNTINHSFGEDPNNPEFIDNNGKSMRGFYSWPGPFQGSPRPSYAEDWGTPKLDAPEAGTLGTAKYAGCVTLHADVSSQDQSDDPLQPRNSWFISSDGTHADQNVSQYNESEMQERYDIMSEGHPTVKHDGLVGDEYPADYNDPKRNTGGGTSQGQGFGPYTLAPGDSIHIVFAEGVSGISWEKGREVGANWLQWYNGTSTPTLIKPDGSQTTDYNLYKRIWFETGKDSILKTYRNAINNYNAGYNIHLPPPPPDSFIVTSYQGMIRLTWSDNAASDPLFNGYVIYRSRGNVMNWTTVYEKIFECNKSNVVHSFDDVTVERDSEYFYYIQSKNDGSNNDVNLGVPLLSSKFYTMTNKPASLITDVEKDGRDILRYFTLKQNYPNPFNPSTNFEFRLPAEAFAKAGIADRGFVSLKVFDLLGNEVATIVNEELSAGSYKYPWNASGLASGVYFYKLQAGNFSDVKKLILMK